jgi:membrane fusion protein, multidrug efflux system
VRYIVTIAGILVVIVVLVALKGAQIGKLIAFGKQMEASGPPPEAVSTALADDQAWEELLTSIGSVATAKGVALSTDVAGVVTRITFESGATVKQGEIVAELESGVERAQLASALARKSLAETTLKRTLGLARSGSISPAQVDADQSQLATATRDAEAVQAQIARKTIRAPFAGRLGIRQVNQGQYLNPGTPVTVLETADAAHVDFSLPQQRLSEVAVGMPARITITGSEDAPFTPNKAGDGTGERGAAVATIELEGKVAAVDPNVDPATRNVKLRADIDGNAAQLRPGMFVNVAVVLPKKANIVAVPATAIVHAPYGDSVFIVEDKKTESGAAASPPSKVARQQFVKVGQARGDFVSVLKGVKAKEEIVVAGGFKLRNNWPVTVDNKNQPVPHLNPHPENR